jgi:hypothetical protein
LADELLAAVDPLARFRGDCAGDRYGLGKRERRQRERRRREFAPLVEIE